MSRGSEAGAESDWEWRDGAGRGDAGCQSRVSGLHVAEDRQAGRACEHLYFRRLGSKHWEK